MATYTVGPGKDFESLNEAVATRLSGAGLTDYEVWQCYGGQNLHDGSSKFTIQNLNGHILRIEAASGHETNGVWDEDRAYIWDGGGTGGYGSVAFQGIFEPLEPGLEVSGLQIWVNNNDLGVRIFNLYEAGCSLFCERCVLRGGTLGDKRQHAVAALLNVEPQTQATFVNNLVYGFHSTYSTDIKMRGAFLSAPGNGGCTVWAAFNTIVDCDYGLLTDTSEVVSFGNLVADSTLAGFEVYDGGSTWASGSDYNVSDDATSTGGANDLTNQSIPFTDQANRDYTLSSNFAPIGNPGTLADDFATVVATDLLGNTRTQWNPGAFEYTGGAGGSDGTTKKILSQLM